MSGSLEAAILDCGLVSFLNKGVLSFDNGVPGSSPYRLHVN